MMGKVALGVGAALLVSASFVQINKGSSGVNSSDVGKEYCGNPNPTSVVASPRQSQIAFMAPCVKRGDTVSGGMVNTLILTGEATPQKIYVADDTNPTMLGYGPDDSIYWASTWSNVEGKFTDELKLWSYSARDNHQQVVKRLKLPFVAVAAQAVQSDEGWLLRVTSPPMRSPHRNALVAFKGGELIRLPDGPVDRILFWSPGLRAFIGVASDQTTGVSGVYTVGLDGKVSEAEPPFDALKADDVWVAYTGAATSPVALRVRQIDGRHFRADLISDSHASNGAFWDWKQRVSASAISGDGKYFAVALEKSVEIYSTDEVGGAVASFATEDAPDALPVFSSNSRNLFIVEQTGVSMIEIGE